MTIPRALLQGASPTFVKSLEKYLASCRYLRIVLHRQIKSKQELKLPQIIEFEHGVIEAHANKIEAFSRSLLDTGEVAGRADIELQLANLSDRSKLEAIKVYSSKEIARLISEERFQNALSETKTKPVTDLGAKVADEFLTNPMRDRFQREIVSLAGERVRAEVTRTGTKYGSPKYQVRLFANPKVPIHMVLSEGEQTCVSLAAYLMELSNASHNSALIFDDPVSSLDHKWRRKVAKRLVEESANRQVIIFTHDLVFLNEISAFSESNNRPCSYATLSRGAAGCGIFTVGLPWRAASIRDRIDKLEKKLREAKRSHEVGEEEEYRRLTSTIYSELRATWERALEVTVFADVLQRHRTYINTKNLKRVTALSDADVNTFDIGFKKCCEFTESHDPSRGSDGDIPDPLEVMTDIQNLKRWEAELRQKQNALN